MENIISTKKYRTEIDCLAIIGTSSQKRKDSMGSKSHAQVNDGTRTIRSSCDKIFSFCFPHTDYIHKNYQSLLQEHQSQKYKNLPY